MLGFASLKVHVRLLLPQNRCSAFPSHISTSLLVISERGLKSKVSAVCLRLELLQLVSTPKAGDTLFAHVMFAEAVCQAGSWLFVPLPSNLAAKF